MPTYEDVYNALVTEWGIPPAMAKELAPFIVGNVQSTWDDWQIYKFVDNVAQKALALQEQEAIIAKGESGLAAIGRQLKTPMRTLIAELPQEPQMAKTEPLGTAFGEGWLIERLGDYGVYGQKAKELTAQLSQIDVSNWDDAGIDRYVRDWADIAKSEDYQQKMAMYNYYYDWKTGLAKGSPELLERQSFQQRQELRPEEQQILAEQQPIEYMAGLKARKGTEKALKTYWTERHAREAWEAAKPNMPSPQSEPYLQGKLATGEYSPAMTRWAEREMPSLYATSGMPQARQSWWAEKTAYVPPGRDEEAQANAEAEKQRRAALPDPWEQFSEAYNYILQQKWQALSPQERGFYPSKSRPRARWLG